jgi:exopolyphosphatase/guanosine-5'-triphosphate,3'-diphosphate pyrophosphatase
VPAKLPIYAVIDLGSYTAKLTIANVDGKVSIIEKDEYSIGLGQDFQEDKGILKPNAIRQAASLVSKWQNRIKQYGAVKTGVFATGVSRIAKNKDQFVALIYKKTGLTLQILSEEDEARILYEGVISDFQKGFSFVVLNVGGSTTRVIIGRDGSMVKPFYIKIGTIELNKLLRSDPPTNEEINSLQEKIENSFEKINFNEDLKNSILIHTGGELDYVLSAGCRVEKSTLSPTHPYKVRLSDFENFHNRILRMRKEELRSLKPDNPKWMDGAIASNAILIYIAHKFSFKEFIPSNRNVTDGFLIKIQREYLHGLRNRGG